MIRYRRPDERICGLTRGEVEQLTCFNSEVYRGIIHTPEYQKHMAALQKRYNRGRERERRKEEETGVMVVEPWSP
jgi:hypothetical protein